MISSEVLQSLGIHSGLLSIDERSFLDELAEIEGNAAGSAPHQEVRYRTAKLLDKDPLFEKFVITPRVLAGIYSCDRPRYTTLIALQQNSSTQWAGPTKDYILIGARRLNLGFTSFAMLLCRGSHRVIGLRLLNMFSDLIFFPIIVIASSDW